MGGARFLALILICWSWSRINVQGGKYPLLEKYNHAGKLPGFKSKSQGHCSSTHCKNGGTCFRNANDISCVCANDWVGSRCEVSTLPPEAYDVVGDLRPTTTEPPGPTTTEPPGPTTTTLLQEEGMASRSVAAGQCGEDNVVVKKELSMSRIVGGQEAVKNSIPWQVAIVAPRGRLGPDTPFCGGTIIDSTHILTAAHCTKNRKASQIQVLTGMHETSATHQATRHDVKSIADHPSYKHSHYEDWDYSILTIDCKNKIDLNGNARAACLPESDAYEESGAMFNVSGWGMQSSDAKELTNKLRVVSVQFISDSVCTAKYANPAKPWQPAQISKAMICAGKEEGGIDACQMDSGGPLTWKDAQGKWNIIGVVSFGYGCADSRYPGVYSEVFTALDWIKSNIQAGGKEQCN